MKYFLDLKVPFLARKFKLVILIRQKYQFCRSVLCIFAGAANVVFGIFALLSIFHGFVTPPHKSLIRYVFNFQAKTIFQGA